jgi:hypothetical protein
MVTSAFYRGFVDHSPEKAGVGGSIPSLATTSTTSSSFSSETALETS